MVVSGEIAEVRSARAIGALACAVICAALIAFMMVDNARAELMFGIGAGVALAVLHFRVTGQLTASLPPAVTTHNAAPAIVAAPHLDLAHALNSGQIVPWFQPQVSIVDGTLLGVEALARWHHPHKGMISPGQFLPLAERLNLMTQIDEAMLTQSLDALRGWRQEGLIVPRVSINLSARQLGDPFLTDRIRWALDARDLDPDSLCVEILEGTLIASADCLIARNIAALSRIGVQIDLDDFGTGHSSITTLDRIKVDRIKIDRSFITGIDGDPKRQTFLKAMVDLARPLAIRVLAEGVETRAELAEVRRIGCREGQGFVIAKPMPANAFAGWLHARKGSVIMSNRPIGLTA